LLAVLCALPIAAFADDNDDDGLLPIQLQAAKPVFDNTKVAKKSTKLFGSAQALGDRAGEPGPKRDNQSIEIWRGSTMRNMPPPLSAEIKKSDDLPPLQAQSAQSDKQKLLQAHDVWFRIPAWMAGSWQTKDKMLLGQVNLRTGKETPARQLKFGYCFEPYGLQQDAHGAYWQFEKVGGIPSNYHIDKNGIGHFNAVDSYVPLSSTKTQLVLQKNWHNATIDPATNEIRTTKYMQSVLTFTLSGADEMNVQEVSTTFAKDGAPITRSITQTVRCRVEPYKEIASLKGHDLRASFQEYMTAR
jgi:hypothetical protein